AGAERAADAVRYARAEHHLRTLEPWEREWVVLQVRKYFLGHGVHTFRPLAWLFGLFGLGVVAACFSKDEFLNGFWP
ncbi:MAG: hypothetical protein AAFP78_09995, partial [Pseudomonadota bacterium]